MRQRALLAIVLTAAGCAAVGAASVRRSTAAGSSERPAAAQSSGRETAAPPVDPQVSGEYVARAEPLPGPEVEQPIAFSHRIHAEKGGLDCLACHGGATTGDAATLPASETCLACHATIVPGHPEIAKLRAQPAGRIAWARVYVLPHYVFFSHREHSAKGVACAECHGPVAVRDVVRKEVSTGMNACLACHRRTEAPVHCAACHTLGH